MSNSFEAPDHGHQVGSAPENTNGGEVIAVNESQWHDWTSTWRKVGTGTASRHVTMTGTITRGRFVCEIVM